MLVAIYHHDAHFSGMRAEIATWATITTVGNPAVEVILVLTQDHKALIAKTNEIGIDVQTKYNYHQRPPTIICNAPADEEVMKCLYRSAEERNLSLVFLNYATMDISHRQLVSKMTPLRSATTHISMIVHYKDHPGEQHVMMQMLGVLHGVLGEARFRALTIQKTSPHCLSLLGGENGTTGSLLVTQGTDNAAIDSIAAHSATEGLLLRMELPCTDVSYYERYGAALQYFITKAAANQLPNARTTMESQMAKLR
jgi:hypothetical protein